MKKRGLIKTLLTIIVLGLATFFYTQYVDLTAVKAAELKSWEARSEKNAKEARIDWQQCAGETIHAAVLRAVMGDAQIEMVPEFEKLTGIKVVSEVLAENMLWQKEVLDLSTGTAAYDYMWVGAWYSPKYAKEKWVADLSKFLGDPKLTDPEWYDYEDIFPSIRNAFNIGGYVVAIPLDGVTHVLFYRKDIFDKYGITVPKTMDQLLGTAGKLTMDWNGDGKVDLYGIGLRGTHFAVTQPAFMYTYGGGFLSKEFKPIIDSPQSIAGMKRYVELVKNYGPPGSASKIWSDVLEDFRGGLTAMTVDTLGFSVPFEQPEKSKVVGKVSLADIPGLTAEKPGEPGWWSWAVGINAASKHQKAAWLYMMWTTSKIQSLKFVFKRVVTGRNWVTQQPEYLDLAGGYNYGNFLPAFTKGMKIARGDYLGTQIGGVPVPEAVEVVKTTHVEMSSAIAGEKTVEQAMKDAARLIEKTMEKAGYYR